jgi:DNA-binding NtrC family response regulator
LASAVQDPIIVPKHIPYQYRTTLLKGPLLEVKEGPLPGRGSAEESHEKFPPLAEYRDKFERNYLYLLLNRAKGNREKACALSGISQSQLYALLKKHNLSRFKP